MKVVVVVIYSIFSSARGPPREVYDSSQPGEQQRCPQRPGDTREHAHIHTETRTDGRGQMMDMSISVERRCCHYRVVSYRLTTLAVSLTQNITNIEYCKS